MRPRGVRGALSLGFSIVPEERRGDGIFGQLSPRAKIPMMRMESSLAGGHISGTREKKLADEYIPRMSIVVRDRDQKAAYVSGGNQQKGL